MAGREVRATHRKKAKPRRDWRTRADPFEAVWAQIEGWLEAEPERTAKDLFEQLQSEHPGQFPSNQLRTLQRRVKSWRSATARQLVFAGEEPIGSDLGGVTAHDENQPTEHREMSL